MSTLKVNDIIEATSGGGKIFPARVWLNFNGSGTIAIRDDDNVSSLVDRTTGQYTVNFTNAMPVTHYCTADSSAYTYQSTNIIPYSRAASNPNTTTQCYMANGNEYEGGTVYQDYPYMSLVAFGQ